MLGAAALWGSFGIFARALFSYGFSAIELVSLRVAIAFLATAAIAAVTPGQLRRLRITGRDAAFFAVYGTLGFASFALLFFVTVELTTVAVAAALLYTSPAFVVLFSRVLWKEPVTRVRALALGCVLAGVFTVTGAAPALLTGGSAVPTVAVLAGLGSGLTYGIYTVMSKVATRRFDTVTTIFYVFLVAGVVLAVAAPPWTAFAKAPQAWPLLLALGLGPSLLSYFLFLAGLRQLTAGTASMLAALEPVMAAIFAALLLAEPLDPPRVAGIALIVGAAMLLVRRAR